ncbi:MAG: hypothetical protein HY840_14915 [Bacteroidetes bacterium]|nr:hypothetical protein [Bacteroidota bacterium]
MYNKIDIGFGPVSYFNAVQYQDPVTGETIGISQDKFYNLSLLWTIGKKIVYADEITLDYGIRLGAFLLSGVSEVYASEKQQALSDRLYSDISSRLFSSQFINFHISVGLLCKLPRKKDN